MGSGGISITGGASATPPVVHLTGKSGAATPGEATVDEKGGLPAAVLSRYNPGLPLHPKAFFTTR